MLISAKLAPTCSYAELERFWRLADELGFYGVWDYDHFYGPDAIGDAVARGYGIPFPSAGERIAILDEALRVIKALWTEDTASFDGQHFRLEDAICNPKPVQKPHPPIVVAGQGAKKSLRVVATHADEWNGTSIEP